MRIFFTSLIIAFTGTVWSQSCKDQVIQAIAHMGAYDSEASVHLVYDISITSAKSDSAQRSSIEVFMSGDNIKVLSDNISMYQDGKYNLTVVNDSKLIIITRSQKKEHLPWKAMGLLQDSVVRSSTVVICERTCTNGEINREEDHIKLILNESSAKALGFSKLEYWIEPSSAEINKFRVVFGNSSLMKDITIHIREYNKQYDQEIFDRRVKTILTIPEKALLLFKGYTIRDNR